MADQFGKDVTVDGVRGHGNNLFLATLAGLVAAVLGALLWMGVAVVFQLQIGIVALAIGAMVGFAVRVVGNGNTLTFGILGAILTFAGCLGGEILTTLYRESSAQIGIFDLLEHVDLTTMVTLIFKHMDIMGYVIYGIGIYEGFTLSIRK